MEDDVLRTCALFNGISLGTPKQEGGAPAEQHPAAPAPGEAKIVDTSNGVG